MNFYYAKFDSAIFTKAGHISVVSYSIRFYTKRHPSDVEPSYIATNFQVDPVGGLSCRLVNRSIFAYANNRL